MIIRTYGSWIKNSFVGVDVPHELIKCRPGDLVRNGYDDEGAVGIVVANDGSTATVVWSKDPNLDEDVIYFRQKLWDAMKLCDAGIISKETTLKLLDLP